MLFFLPLSSSCSSVRPDPASVPGLGLPPDVWRPRLSLRPAPRPPLPSVLPGVWPHPGGGRPGGGQGRGGGGGRWRTGTFSNP